MLPGYDSRVLLFEVFLLFRLVLSAAWSRFWLLLAALVLAGCAELSLPERPQIELPWFGTQQRNQVVDDRLAVLVWDEGEATETLRELLATFETQNPGARTNLIVSTNLAADLQRMQSEGQAPDLILVDSFRFPDWAAEGMLAAPGNRLESSDDFYPLLVDAFRHDGRLYCLPREVRTLALVYDQRGFTAANLRPPTTWDEMRRAAEILTDENTLSLGLIVSPDLSRWLPFLYQAGGAFVDDGRVMAIDSPQAAAALDFYITIFRANFAGEPGETRSSWAGEVLGKRKGSMAVEGNWIVPYFAEHFPNYEYGIAPLPSGPGGRGTLAFTSCYAVTVQSNRQDVAFALANFLTSRDAMQQWPASGAFMPSRISLWAAWLDEFPTLSPFLDGLAEARVWQFPPGFEPLLRTFNRSMAQLFAATIQAEDLLAEVQRTGQQVLE
jgi:multiple sugar transport system substrate-binding protein